MCSNRSLRTPTAFPDWGWREESSSAHHIWEWKTDCLPPKTGHKALMGINCVKPKAGREILKIFTRVRSFMQRHHDPIFRESKLIKKLLKIIIKKTGKNPKVKLMKSFIHNNISRNKDLRYELCHLKTWRGMSPYDDNSSQITHSFQSIQRRQQALL